jgi:NADH-quinone oxidoreductase subunit K
VIRPAIPYVTAALLFGLGVYGVLRRRNAVLVLMSVELMLNAVNLILVTADTTVRAALPATGQVFTLFVIVIAAAEVGVGLAIVLHLYRLRASIAVDEVPLAHDSRGAAPPGTPPDRASADVPGQAAPDPRSGAIGQQVGSR